jgi:16S rRNA (cytidine1402-2'-O)-methyltransferase
VSAGYGTLFIIATPIGTLGDFPPRAREVLETVSLILAEDTRRARILLDHAGVVAGRRLRSFHEHNEAARLQGALELLQRGESVALTSDAGTPVLSDPGFVLVREARRAGIPIGSVPGPSSFTAALAASGQPPLPAILVGFLPARPGARKNRIDELAAFEWTMVVLLSPHRLADELTDLADGLGDDRPATLVAEISKAHERARLGTLAELASSDEAARPRGEYVLVVGPPQPRATAVTVSREKIVRSYQAGLDRGLGRTQAIKAAAAKLGLGRRDVFDALVVESESDR